ncbi:hypothetical protein KIL84_009483 [Mauremys mutica]|uniref:Condensin-2 complex subunit H2 n=1 Tax=Mauremys mutica TaxID=74926 RepID=A0A9D3XYS6_9SAUR|nr:hypothetical protein KIL84_009483 [Mauremys mutica]
MADSGSLYDSSEVEKFCGPFRSEGSSTGQIDSFPALYEERAAFDIHSYGDQLVASCGRLGEWHSFASLVAGKPAFEVCRSMLASLQLLYWLPPGSIMVGCGKVALDAAEKAAREAQEAVNRHTNEASSYAAEVCRYEEQERQVEAEIAANEQRLAQIDVEQQALAVLQGEIVTLQDGLRKCTTLVNGLAGKVCVAKRLTEDLLIYEELANILREVVQQVLPLMSPGGEAGTRFLAAGELQGLIGKLESGGSSLRALADAEAAAIEF